MFGSHRNMNAYVDSLEKLDLIKDRFDEIWPSHAEFPVYPEIIPKLCSGAKAIINKDVTGKTVEFFGRSIVVYDLGFTGFLCSE